MTVTFEEPGSSAPVERVKKRRRDTMARGVSEPNVRGRMPSPGGLLELQRTGGNRSVSRLIRQRDDEPVAPHEEQEAPAPTIVPKAIVPKAKQGKQDPDPPPPLGPKSTKAVAKLLTAFGAHDKVTLTEKIAARYPDGPLLSQAELQAIRNVSARPAGRSWLRWAGIGTVAGAESYLGKHNYKNWLKLDPARRLLIATLAWETKDGRDDTAPPPSYTLARHMALKTGGLSAKDQKTHGRERDAHIREAFVSMMMTRDLNPEAKAGVEAGRVRRKKVAKTVDEVEREHQHAMDIVENVFLILRNALQVYDKGAGGHVPYQGGDVARALAHGGRVNIRIPALRKGETAHDLTDWIGITDGGHKTDHALRKRMFGTHHMQIKKNTSKGLGSFQEFGEKKAAARNRKSPKKIKLWGMNVPAGGIGSTDFNGDVVLPDGGHGHMFLGFKAPTKTKDGALQVGMETTAPHKPSPVGYKHGPNSSEATANPESSFYGHKTDKIGQGRLRTNQRYVDLRTLEEGPNRRWLAALEGIHDAWLTDLQRAQSQTLVQEREVYERLIGPRERGRLW